MLGNLANWHTGVLAVAAVLMIVAAITDVRKYRIPNHINLALLALFPVHVLTSPQEIVWLQNVIVFAVVLAVGFLFYAKKWIGAGDVKFLAIQSLWAGVNFISMFLLITTLAGGLLAVMMIALAYLRHRRSQPDQKFTTNKMPIPYGVAITIGGLCMLLAFLNPALIPLRS